jgi:endonuclease YncB( thermonuclease family)
MASLQRKADTYAAEIVRFIDGDTMICRIALPLDVHTDRRVRLIGIESWELIGAERTEALEAAAQLNRDFSNAEITLQFSPGALDRYGRILAKAEIDGQDLAALLIARGTAWPFGDRDALAHAEKNWDVTSATLAKIKAKITAGERRQILLENDPAANSEYGQPIPDEK